MNHPFNVSTVKKRATQESIFTKSIYIRAVAVFFLEKKCQECKISHNLIENPPTFVVNICSKTCENQMAIRAQMIRFFALYLKFVISIKNKDVIWDGRSKFLQVVVHSYFLMKNALIAELTLHFKKHPKLSQFGHVNLFLHWTTKELADIPNLLFSHLKTQKR